MKAIKLILAMIALTLAGVGVAQADRGHGHFGVYIGAPIISPYWGPGYYPHYYYPPAYYPPVVIERQSPPVYIEQSQPAPVAPAASAPAAAPDNYWYYCADAKAYYPYVKNCPSPWQRVSPQPPAPQ